VPLHGLPPWRHRVSSFLALKRWGDGSVYEYLHERRADTPVYGEFYLPKWWGKLVANSMGDGSVYLKYA